MNWNYLYAIWIAIGIISVQLELSLSNWNCIWNYLYAIGTITLQCQLSLWFSSVVIICSLLTRVHWTTDCRQWWQTCLDLFCQTDYPDNPNLNVTRWFNRERRSTVWLNHRDRSIHIEREHDIKESLDKLNTLGLC